MPRAIAHIVKLIERDKKPGERACKNKQEQADKQKQEEVKEEVYRLIDKAIKDPELAKYPATWYYRGLIYEKRFKDNIASTEASTFLDEALIAYKQVKTLSLPKRQFHGFALERIAGLWYFYLDRGIRYAKQEIFDQAIDSFTICRAILPEEAQPLLYTAIVYQANDKPKEALRNYEAYLQIHAPDPAIFRAMANSYWCQLKNFNAAIALLDRGLILFPFDNELLEEYCLLHKSENRLHNCKALLFDMLVGKPGALSEWYKYAYIVEYQGFSEEAACYYQQILQLQPRHYIVLRQLGLLFYNEAIKSYAEVQKMDGIMGRMEQETYPQDMVWVIPRLYPSFFKPTFLVYAHPLNQSLGLAISDRIKSGKISYIDPLFCQINQQISAELLRGKRIRMIMKIKVCLKQAIHYLNKARKEDKKDKEVAQALYYSYYHMQQYRSAFNVLHTKQGKHLNLGEDPFSCQVLS